MLRSFAIVPAAGVSARLGAPKLLLSVNGRPLIEHVLAAWTQSVVTRTVVVARASDEPLLERCRQSDVDVVTPAVDPADMKTSVQFGLRYVEERYAPDAEEPWLLAPADLPHLSSRMIDAVLAAYDPAQPAAIVPAAAGRRGHPALLPWRWAAHVHRLHDGEGVNALLARLPVREVPWDDVSMDEDLDTLADYTRLTSSASRARPAELAAVLGSGATQQRTRFSSEG
jgi:molybdenum cofactor cytidylyltransferase